MPSRTYRIWVNMRYRCHTHTAPNYAGYGGRGIQVCDRWDSFQNFLSDMGEAPEGMTLDRIDNEGHYCKENCRWASVKVQSRNRRSTKLITFRGKTQAAAAWAEDLGMNDTTILERLNRGWSVEDALTKPLVRGNTRRRSS